MLSPTNTAGGARYYHSLLVGFVSFFVCLLFLGSNIFHWLLKKKNLSLLNSWNNRSSELKTCDRYSPQLTVLSLLFKDWKKKKKRGWWSLFFVHQSEDRGENDRWVFCFLIFATSDANRLEVPVSMRNKVIKVPDKKKKNSTESELRFWAEEVEVQTYVWQPKLHWSLTLNLSLQGTSIWVTKLQNGGQEKETVREKMLQQNNHKLSQRTWTQHRKHLLCSTRQFSISSVLLHPLNLKFSLTYLSN